MNSQRGLHVKAKEKTKVLSFGPDQVPLGFRARQRPFCSR